MSNFAIIAIGYNRVESMERLLLSLNNVNYMDEKVTLIISIDNSGSNSVEELAEKFNWKYGNKIVKTYPERLGLRKHILKCGEFTQQYDAVAIFEDDIYVSPNFFRYMVATVEFYKNDNNIAGISLYSHLWNPNMNRSFLPKYSQYDTYFSQFAQSWGQIWLPQSWKDFIDWYENNSEEIKQLPHLPNNVVNWPKSSWLKYHIKYCIENNKYFVYPYESLSTNFSDKGEHVAFSGSHYQVPMQYNTLKEYNLAPFEKGSVKYDAFFERQEIGEKLGIDDRELCVDIYGQKINNENKKYWLTMHKANYKVIKSYGLKLRPQEMNILLNIQGDDIFLYDTSEPMINTITKNSLEKQCEYDLRAFPSKRLPIITYKRYLNYVISKLNKFWH